MCDVAARVSSNKPVDSWMMGSFLTNASRAEPRFVVTSIIPDFFSLELNESPWHKKT